MSTPQDPGRPEDRPPEQSRYPDAPPPPESESPAPGAGQTSHQGFPPAPDFEGNPTQDAAPAYEQGAPGQSTPAYGDQGAAGYDSQGTPGFGDQAPGHGDQGAPGYGEQGAPGQGAPGQGAPGQGAPGYGDQGAPGQGAPGQGGPAQPYAGGPPGGGSPYGNAPAYDPYAAPGFGAPPTGPSLPPPKEVVWATYAMYASIAFSLINLIVTLADSTGYKNAIRDADPNRTVDVDAVYTAAVVFAVIVTLLIAALYVFLAINLRKGKNWARITTWVVVGIFTLLGLLGLGNDVPGIARVLGIIVLLANAATLVLLAMRPSNEFFARMRQPRF